MKPFVPEKLPLNSIDWEKIVEFIGQANQCIARYDGVLQTMPNPEILLSPLTTREAVISSKIEGTQATLDEVLKFEGERHQKENNHSDIFEIFNYRSAMEHAKAESIERGISLNLLRRTHEILLRQVRGQSQNRGNFRKSQNWIGKPGSTQKQARFVPPSPETLMDHLSIFEKYIHSKEKDLLVQIAIIHAQFEIIHPFLDGNGRIGRILIPLFLFDKKVLHEPTFYISDYFDKNRQEYYDRLLMITNEGNWTQWIEFFLKAIIEQARDNHKRAMEVVNLYEEMKDKVSQCTRSQFSISTLDCLFTTPYLNSRIFIDQSQIPRQSALRILNQIEQCGIIEVIRTGRGSKPTLYGFPSLLQIVNKP